VGDAIGDVVSPCEQGEEHREPERAADRTMRLRGTTAAPALAPSRMIGTRMSVA